MKPGQISARLTRLIRMIGILQSGQGQNAQSLADEFRVAKRTIFRDLDLLRVAGVPVAYDDDQQRFHLAQTFYQPATALTPDEALAVLVLCHELGDGGRLPFLAPAKSAVAKLEHGLSASLRKYVRGLVGSVHIALQATTNQTAQYEVYRQLLTAIGDRRCVRIEYHDATECMPIATRLSPYRLLFSRHAWHVIGRSSLHRAARTFHLSCLVKLEPLEESFRIPRGFSLERHLRNAWRLVPEPGPDHAVVVRFQPPAAHEVADVTWHKTQQVAWNADGSLEFRALVSGLNEISAWILGFGDQAEVIAPPKLRALVAARCEGMARMYRTAE